jgi:hypothetical protein
MPGNPAAWLAEALTSGNSLGPLPAPPSVADGQRIAAEALELAGLEPCGLRLAQVPGPLLEGRLLRSGATVALATLRHATLAPALLAWLAEPLSPEGSAMPGFTSLHAALDIATSRFTTAPESPALLAADLGGLGHVVVGRAVPPPALEGPWAVALRPPGRRPRPQPCDVGARLRAAVAAAREAGGLPAGALLAVALGPGVAPVAGVHGATIGPLGSVRVVFSG